MGSDNGLPVVGSAAGGRQANPGCQKVIVKGLEELRVFNKGRAYQDGIEACGHVVVVQEGQHNKLVLYLVTVDNFVAIEPGANWLMLISHPTQDGLPKLEKAALAGDMLTKRGMERIALFWFKVQQNSKALN